VEQYGYSPGDLIYFKDHNKYLVVGLHLVSLDYDVAYMSSLHVENHVVELYLHAFRDDGGGDMGDGEDDEKEDVGSKLILILHGRMIKLAMMMMMFLKMIIMWIRLAPQLMRGVEGDENRDGDGDEDGLRVLELTELDMRILEMRILELMVRVSHLHLTTTCTHLKTLRWMTIILK